MRWLGFLWVGLVACSGTTTDTTDDPLPNCDEAYYGNTEGIECGELTRDGSGTASSNGGTVTGYTGEEVWVFRAGFGYGDDLCTLSYDLTSTAPHVDCPANCGKLGWAFDMDISNAAIGTNVDGACDRVLDILGLSDVTDLNGTQTTRGYDPDWEGHAEYLWLYDAEAEEWNGGTYCQFDEGSGEVTYSFWYDGIYAY